MSLLNIIIALAGRARHGGNPPPSPTGQTFGLTKNIQPLNTSSIGGGIDYWAFGFLMPKWLYSPAGTGHLTGKNVYRFPVEDTVDGAIIGSPALVRDCAGIAEDVAGGLMSDGNHIVFFTESPNGYNASGVYDQSTSEHTTAAYYIRYNEVGVQIGLPVSIMPGNFGIPDSDKIWAFGLIQNHDTPGHCSINIVQLNIDTIPTTTRRVGLLYSEDNFATAPEYRQIEVNDGTGSVFMTGVTFSENVHFFIPGYGLAAFVRLDLGSNWVQYYSEDVGLTWTVQGSCNLGFDNSSLVVMSGLVENGMVHFILQDRGNAMILASLNNDPAYFYGHPDRYNPCRIISFNLGVNSVYHGLGYPTMRRRPDGVYAYTYTEETNGDFTGGPGGSARLHFSLDNFTRTIPPAAATGLTQLVNSSAATIYLTGLSATDIENIDGFYVSVFTDAGRTTVAALSWKEQVTGEDVDNIWMPATEYHFTHCAASTTYYIDIISSNDAGTALFQGSFTTSA